MKRSLPYLLVVVGLASCASSGTPLYRATEEGRIYVADPRTGSRIEKALLRFGPAVREMLGVEDGAGTPDVYFQKQSGLKYEVLAVTFPTRIVIDETGRSDLEYSVAHELAHWYMPRSVFAKLPLFAQEGLAVYVGLTFFPPFLDQLGRAGRWESSPPLPSHLYLDADGWYQLSPDERTELSGLALEVVYRIGLDELRGLCEQGDPSIPSLLEHAGLYAPSAAKNASGLQAGAGSGGL